jgi:Ca2+/H+ antiporter, TMEM165/GDT1 family
VFGVNGNSGVIVLLVAVFLASAVEMVEALTIVVAAGISRGWRSALEGAGAAVLVLAVLVAALGPALIHLIPLDALRVVIGAVLLIFGLQWLRKAILRATGYKAKHDENAIFAAQVRQFEEAPRSAGFDQVGFTVAFKGVFLEGLEVVIIVLTLGATGKHLGLAGLAAGAAALLVAGVGIVVAKQLAGVPENAIKMCVGLMLVSFGSFWTGEGIGVHWPGADAAIPVLVGVYGLAAFLIVRTLRIQKMRASEKGRRAQLV